MDIRYRHLGRWNQEVIDSVQPEEVFLELGQLARAGHAFPVYHKGRKHFNIIVPPGVEVEHEVDERPLKPGPGPLVEGETGTGQPGAPLEVEYVEGFADLPVRLRRKG